MGGGIHVIGDQLCWLFTEEEGTEEGMSDEHKTR